MIAELLKNTDPDTSKRMKQFSDLLNLNHLHGLKNQTNLYSLQKKKDYSSKTAEMIIQPIVNRFCQEFNPNMKHFAFQFRLAKWQFSHKKYASAYISLQESIVSYLCWVDEMDSEKRDNREIIKEFLYDALDIVKGKKQKDNTRLKDCDDLLANKCEAICEDYNKIRYFRNSLAHSSPQKKNAEVMIKSLEKQIESVGVFYGPDLY